MMNMELKTKDLFSISHYEYGEAYYGSLSGMRFRLAREPLEDVHFEPEERRKDAVLRAAVWPEPDSFRTAPASAKTIRDFPFSGEGLQQAAEWISDFHDQHPDLWPQTAS